MNKRQRKKQEKRLQEQRLQQDTQKQLDNLQNRVDKYAAKEAELNNVFNSDEFNTIDLHNQMKKQIEDINASRYQQEQIEKVQKATINQEKRKAAEDVAKMDALHGEALKENRIRDIVSDAVQNNDSMNEAQSYLNRVARNKKINTEELHDAKEFLRNGESTYYPPKAKRLQDIKLKPGEETLRLKNIENGNLNHKVYNPATGARAKMNPKYFRNSADEVIADLSRGSEELGKTHLKKALSGRNLNALVNLGLSIVDYKDAREAGDGVLKAGVKAGAQFAAGEMLGFWMMPVALAKSAPTLAIKAFETTQSITRNMNSATRLQTFGEAQFQDTQQLATMRQAGMELAKMSQYNLQQSIMGNEAQYMHRL